MKEEEDGGHRGGGGRQAKKKAKNETVGEMDEEKKRNKRKKAYLSALSSLIRLSFKTASWTSLTTADAKARGGRSQRRGVGGRILKRKK